MESMQQDIDDLVGRPPSTDERVEAALETVTRTNRAGTSSVSPFVEDMHAGVTVSWLAQVFGMDPQSVKRKLADCPPLHRRKAGYVYHLPTACRYLVKSALTTEQVLKVMRTSDLPSSMQDSYWAGQLKRQKWEENAGQLWRTEHVREVLGNTFQTIKFTIQLWADTLERQTGLTPEQRGLVHQMADALQQEIYEALVRNAAATETGPQLAELPKMLGEVENDYAHLV